MTKTASQLQQIVDAAAILNLFVAPSTAGAAQASQLVKFDCGLETNERTPVFRNRLTDKVGSFSGRFVAVPHGSRPLLRTHQSIPFDRTIQQRVAIQGCKLRFEGLGDISCFGTGRTYPMVFNQSPCLAVAAVAEVYDGAGPFAGAVGNLTFCGLLTEEFQFCGHIILRLLDEDGVLAARSSIRYASDSTPLDLGVTFLNFVGQKGDGPDQENQFSLDGNGNPRGLNISTVLRESQVDFFTTKERLSVHRLATGRAIGKEIGFGPLPRPGLPAEGIPDRPFPFEGVASYSFDNRRGKKVGTITTNVVEGRRFDVRFRQAPDRIGYRFGFFGPITCGTGMWEGATGLFYGASASFLTPPPGDHVVTHFYAAMLDDPKGRFRT